RTKTEISEPKTEAEKLLSLIWQKLLRVERVGARDNFFELGGHSLLAVQLFARIEKQMGVKLPIVTIFQSPTLQQLAQAVQRRSHKAAQTIFLPIQPHGEKPPLFLVHGAGGDVLWGYANLAHYTDPAQPIFGMQSVGDREFATLEDMAAYYVEQVREM